MTSQIDTLRTIAENNGFEVYGSFNEGLQHDILTCNKGKYDGEVIDIYWNWKNGKVHTVDYSCQWKNQKSTFTFNRFWDAKDAMSCQNS